MATFDDVRRTALALPEAAADDDGTAFRVHGKLFAWPWLERIEPKRARAPNLEVLNVRIASERDKDVLIAMDPGVFFTEPISTATPRSRCASPRSTGASSRS